MISMFIFGSDTVLSYFSKNPNTDVPNVNYLSHTNLSLLGIILRATDYNINLHPPLFNPLYLIISLTFLIVTIILSFFT